MGAHVCKGDVKVESAADVVDRLSMRRPSS
jgi:hypothetical protein